MGSATTAALTQVGGHSKVCNYRAGPVQGERKGRAGGRAGGLYMHTGLQVFELYFLVKFNFFFYFLCARAPSAFVNADDNNNNDVIITLAPSDTDTDQY